MSLSLVRLTARLRAGLLVASTCTLLAAAPAVAQTPTPVNVRMDVFFYGAHVPILAGIADGTYAKHGLNVTALTGRGSATTIQTVAAGTDHFGFADGGTLAKFAAQGLKAKVVLGMLQTTPAIILAMPDSGIKGPKDLEGRTGGFGNGSAPEQIFPALAKATGVDLGKIKRVGVDIPTRDSLFLQKKIDFSFGYTVTQLPLMEEKCGCKLNTISYAAHGISTMANGIVVSDKYAAENPDVVRRFVRATVESIESAIKDPEKAVDGFFRYAKETQLSRPVVARQWAETAKLLRTPATQGKPIGTMDDADWQRTLDLLTEYADLPKGSVAPAAVYTNAYLPR